MKRTVAVMLVLALVFGLCACTLAEKLIIGTWKSQTKVLGVVTEVSYTFNDDGTGLRSGALDTPFTYVIQEDQLAITTSVLGIDVTEEYTFELSGNELVLTGENETITLERAG